MPAPVLFCSSVVWSKFADQIRAASPGIQVVTFRAGDRVSDEDAARITIAFASDDLYPNELPAFFKVCLESPSLQWIQVFNVGVDHPVFGMMRSTGCSFSGSFCIMAAFKKGRASLTEF